jgi:hypothetical protein
MQGYYSRLEHLRGRLLAVGQDKWAVELLAAERSASTSGEALSNTGVVLRRLLDSDEPNLSDVRDEAASIEEEGHAIWEGR